MKVSIGYAEEPYNENELTSDFFPNKIGGKPAWLDLSCIPKKEELKCSKCSKQLSFLLQVNAPIDGKEHCYHRTIHLFCCLSNECNSYVAIRTQLPQENEIYPIDADERKYEQDYNIDLKYYEKRQKQCEYCGLFASAQCAGCNKVNYCSKEHQQADWELGHREECKLLRSGSSADIELPKKKKSDFHFKQYEIFNEDSDVIAKPSNTVDPNYHKENDDDDVEDDDSEEDDEEDEELNKQIYKDLIVKEGGEAVSNDPETIEQFNEFAEEMGVDAAAAAEMDDNKFMNIKDQEFLYFKRIITQHKDQILRYSREQDYPIIWVSEENKVKSEEIGTCSCCGGERKFEFQILPQLLHFILDSTNSDPNSNEIDFGILNIYTCVNSCEYKSSSTTKPLNYVQEFIFKQDFTK